MNLLLQAATSRTATVSKGATVALKAPANRPSGAPPLHKSYALFTGAVASISVKRIDTVTLAWPVQKKEKKRKKKEKWIKQEKRKNRILGWAKEVWGLFA